MDPARWASGRDLLPVNRLKLSSAGNHGPNEVDPVDCRRHAINRRKLARNRRRPNGTGARAHQHRRSALALGRQGEGQFNPGPRIDLHMRMKEDPRPRNIPQLGRMELCILLAGQTHLKRQEDLVSSCFSTLSHQSPPEESLHKAFHGGTYLSAENKGLRLMRPVKIVLLRGIFSRCGKMLQGQRVTPPGCPCLVNDFRL